MRKLRAAWAVFAFEFQRAFGWSRIAVTLGLAAFPAVILWLIQRQGGMLFRRPEAWSLALFVLVPEIVCLLAVLLWVGPAVQTEVEGKTWPYLAVRPAGKTPVLVGKYAAGVLWSVLAGWLALSLGMGVLLLTDSASEDARLQEFSQNATVRPAMPNQATHLAAVSTEPMLHAWCVIAGLVVLSCAAYGSLFSLLGVIFLRRGMIFGVVYTLLEFAVRWIPAIVKQLTVQYHLQALLVHWMHWADQNRNLETWFGAPSPWQHISILVGYAAFLLAVAAAILRYRELVAVAETAA